MLAHAERHRISSKKAVPPQLPNSISTTSPHFRPLRACRCYRTKYQDIDTHLDGLSRVFGTMLSLSSSQFAFTAAFVLFFVGRRLDAKYVSVDDTDTSRILYSSDSGWNIGDNCAHCAARLDKTKVFGGTWHE